MIHALHAFFIQETFLTGPFKNEYTEKEIGARRRHFYGAVLGLHCLIFSGFLKSAINLTTTKVLSSKRVNYPFHYVHHHVPHNHLHGSF